MRSVELHSFYIAYASVLQRNRDRLFLRDPANARDVPAGPLVAPPSSRSENVGGFVASGLSVSVVVGTLSTSGLSDPPRNIESCGDE